jgi:hypothetical protein
MKKMCFSLIVFLQLTAAWTQVGIGTANPNSNALLDLTSTAKGLLLPRLNSTQRDAISSPTEGLVIYNTTSNAVEVFAKARKGEREMLSFTAGNSITSGIVWQEFTPTTSGFVTKISIQISAAANDEFEMKIHSGVTSTNYSVLNGGQVIGYTSRIFPTTATAALYDFVFSQPVFVQSGTKYWFRMTGIASADASVYINTTDVYPGHTSYVGGNNNEPNFKIFIQPVGQAQWLSLQ